MRGMRGFWNVHRDRAVTDRDGDNDNECRVCQRARTMVRREMRCETGWVGLFGEIGIGGEGYI